MCLEKGCGLSWGGWTGLPDAWVPMVTPIKMGEGGVRVTGVWGVKFESSCFHGQQGVIGEAPGERRGL